MKSMESEAFKNVFLTVLTERIVWKLTQTLLLHKGELSRDDFLGVLKLNLSRLTQWTVCEVCLKAPRDARLALVPCGHQRFCSHLRCPLCRTEIQMVLRLF